MRFQRDGRRHALTGSAIAALLILALAVSGVSFDAGASTRHTRKKAVSTSNHLVVGYADPTAAIADLAAIGAGITARAKRLGVKVVTLDDQLTVSKQVSDIKTLISEHVNGIITFPLSTQAIAPAVAEARKAGIPVVGIGSLGATELTFKRSATSFNSVVSQGDVPNGKLEGRAFARAMHYTGDFVVLNIALPAPAPRYEVHEVAKWALKTHPKMHQLGQEFNTTTNEVGGVKAMDEAITRWGHKIKGVIAYNDYTAEGAAIAIKRNHLAHIPIFGHNGDPTSVTAIKDGDITAVATIRPWLDGATAMNLLDRLMKGTRDVPVVTTVPTILYTKANIGKRLTWAKADREIASGSIKGKRA